DHQSSAWLQDSWRCAQQRLQIVELSVYPNSDCLEGLRRGIDSLVLFHWPGRGRYHLRKMRCTSYRPRPNNGSGDSPRPPFLTEFVNQVGEFFFVEPIYHLIGGALATHFHAHIERSFRLKTESALRVGQLQTAQPQVGHDSVGAAIFQL